MTLCPVADAIVENHSIVTKIWSQLARDRAFFTWLLRGIKQKSLQSHNVTSNEGLLNRFPPAFPGRRCTRLLRPGLRGPPGLRLVLAAPRSLSSRGCRYARSGVSGNLPFARRTDVLARFSLDLVRHLLPLRRGTCFRGSWRSYMPACPCVRTEGQHTDRVSFLFLEVVFQCPPRYM